MKGQTLKILGVIQMLFSAAIFISIGESETLNLSEEKTYKVERYNYLNSVGDSLITFLGNRSLNTPVRYASNNEFAGIYIEQYDKGLIDLGESKEITLNITTKADLSVIVSFEKYLPNNDGTHPFKYELGVKMNADKKEITLPLSDFKTPDRWLEEHPEVKINEVLSDSIVSVKIDFKKIGNKSKDTIVTINEIKLSKGQNNIVLGIGGGVFLIGLILIVFPQKRASSSHVPKNENPIVFYINNNLASRSLTINSVSEHFKLSVKYIDERVKTETGLNYIDYVNQKRVEKAKDLLKTTDENIFEISELCGFKSSESFSEIFETITNLTPNNFRKT